MDREEARLKVIARYEVDSKHAEWAAEQYRILHEMKFRIDGEAWWKWWSKKTIIPVVEEMKNEINEGIRIIMRGRAISEEEERELLQIKRALVVRNGKITTVKLPEWIKVNTKASRYIDDNGKEWIKKYGRFWKPEDIDKLPRNLEYVGTQQGSILVSRDAYSIDDETMQRVPRYYFFPHRANELWVYVHRPHESWIVQNPPIYEFRRLMEYSHPLRITKRGSNDILWKRMEWEYKGAKFVAETKKSNANRYGVAAYVTGELNGVVAHGRLPVLDIQSEFRRAVEALIKTSEEILQKIMNKTQPNKAEMEEAGENSAKKKTAKTAMRIEEKIQAVLLRRTPAETKEEYNTKVYVRGKYIEIHIMKHPTGLFYGAAVSGNTVVVLTIAKRLTDVKAMILHVIKRLTEKYEDADIPIGIFAREVAAALREAATLPSVNQKNVVYVADEEKIKTEWAIGSVLG